MIDDYIGKYFFVEPHMYINFIPMGLSLHDLNTSEYSLRTMWAQHGTIEEIEESNLKLSKFSFANVIKIKFKHGNKNFTETKSIFVLKNYFENRMIVGDTKDEVMELAKLRHEVGE